jgi:hypothetical protein
MSTEGHCAVIDCAGIKKLSRFLRAREYLSQILGDSFLQRGGALLAGGQDWKFYGDPNTG